MKKNKIFILILMSILILTSCGKSDSSIENSEEEIQHVHMWIDATCEEAKYCINCGEKEGKPLIHKYKDATCTEPATCELCGKYSGEAFGHDWISATCTSPKTCSRCKITKGTNLEHEWEAATCIKVKTCKLCKKTEGEKAEHKGGEATCNKKAICEVCKEEYGELIDHNWKNADCENPKTCTVCKTTEGKELGHKGDANLMPQCSLGKKCTVCNSIYDKKDCVFVVTEKREDGFTKTCKVCNYNEIKTINILGGGKYFWCDTCQDIFVGKHDEHPSYSWCRFCKDYLVKSDKCTKCNYSFTITCKDCGETYVPGGMAHICEIISTKCEKCKTEFIGAKFVVESMLKKHKCYQCDKCETWYNESSEHKCAECLTCNKTWTEGTHKCEAEGVKICEKCNAEYLLLEEENHVCEHSRICPECGKIEDGKVKHVHWITQ